MADDTNTTGPVTFQQKLDSALRFWEPGRLLYNVVLGIVVIVMVAQVWTVLEREHYTTMILTAFVLAVLANVCYCAAYVVDLVAQSSSYRPIWIQARSMLLLIGIAFASVIAYFTCWAILPFHLH